MSEQENASVMYLLGEIRGDVKSILASQIVRDERIKSLEMRVGGLERSRSWLVGAWFGVTALGGAALHLLKNGASH